MNNQKLYQNYKYFLSILNTIPHGIYIVNEEHDIQYTNAVIENNFGPVSGRKCYHYFHERKDACPWCKNVEVFSGKSVRWEWYSKKNDTHYDLYDSPITNPDGTTSKFEIFIDITRQKCAENQSEEKREQLNVTLRSIRQAEREYKQREKVLRLYEQIISATNEHMAFLDQNYVYQAANKVYLQAHQKRSEDIIGHSVADLLGEELFQLVVKEKLDRCLAGEEIHYQEWFSFPELGKRYMEVVYYPFFDLNNEIKGVIVSSHDCTVQKQNEELLRKSEIRYHQMFETNAAVKLIIDTVDGRIVETNEAARNFYGYDAETLTSMRIMDINTLSEEQIQQEMALAETAQRIFYNFRHRLASGEIRDVEVYSGPLQYHEKTLLYSIIHDVTDRKHAEQAVQELVAGKMAAEVIKEKNIEVEEANIALRVLLRQNKDVVEDLQQNILAQLEKAVIPYINLLRSHTLDDKGKEYLDIITEHVHTVGSSFIKKLSNPDLGLTKKEILVADMVRQGKNTQEVADLFNLQIRTVEVYRTKIRKKLHLNNKNISLAQYLSTTFNSSE